MLCNSSPECDGKISSVRDKRTSAAVSPGSYWTAAFGAGGDVHFTPWVPVLIRWNIKSRDSRTQMETVAPIPQEICHNFTFWALTYLLVTTYRQIWQDPKSGLHGDPHLHFLFLLFHLSAEGKASPTPPRLLNLLAEMQRTWIIVRRNLRGETKAGTGPGRAWWWNLPPTPPLPVIPDGDFNGGADEAELFRKYLFALYDN